MTTAYEWRFYAILKKRGPSDEPRVTKKPNIVKEKGDPINDQYDPPETGGGADPPFLTLYSVLPEPLSLLRIFVSWKSAIVSSTLFHYSVSETGFGAVCSGSPIQRIHRVRHRKLSARMADR